MGTAGGEEREALRTGYITGLVPVLFALIAPRRGAGLPRSPRFHPLRSPVNTARSNERCFDYLDLESVNSTGNEKQEASGVLEGTAK